jgi:sugar transferase
MDYFDSASTYINSQKRDSEVKQSNLDMHYNSKAIEDAVPKRPYVWLQTLNLPVEILFVLATVIFILFVPKNALNKNRMIYLLCDMTQSFTNALVGVILLALSFPLWIVIAVIIKMESPGPVLSIDQMVGRDRRNGERRWLPKAVTYENRTNDRRHSNLGGKPFKIALFRTITTSSQNVSWFVGSNNSLIVLTNVGRLLTVTGLDRLPLLLNVVKCELRLTDITDSRLKGLADLNYPQSLEPTHVSDTSWYARPNVEALSKALVQGFQRTEHWITAISSDISTHTLTTPDFIHTVISGGKPSLIRGSPWIPHDIHLARGQPRAD